MNKKWPSVIIIKEQNIQGLEDNEVLTINKQVGFLQKRNPIRGAMIVEKLEFINKQNSVVIKFGLLIY